jgi:hypothetical protein
MLTPPTDLDPQALTRALAHWGLVDPVLEYLPVGFGSHHWRAEDAFVTVDEPAAGFAALDRAFRTAAALRAAGLEFVLAPLPDDTGAPTRPLDERYAVSVTPFVNGASSSFGSYETKDERRRMAELVGRVHAATVLLPPGLPRRDDLGIPDRSSLEEALASLSLPWLTGPFAEPTRALLADRADELRRSLEAHDERADRLRRRSRPWVVTHGEPHRANLIVDTAGSPHLVDWDTTLLAPPERDLWQVLDDELTGWEEYRAVVGAVELDLEALGHYRQGWDLADICAFVAACRRPHEEDENTVATFGHLRAYLSG